MVKIFWSVFNVFSRLMTVGSGI